MGKGRPKGFKVSDETKKKIAETRRMNKEKKEAQGKATTTN